MSGIDKLNFISSPIRKFTLNKNHNSNLELLDLRSALKIDLRSDIKDQSLSRLKSKNRSFEVSRAAFFLGSAATLVVTVFMLAQLISVDLNTGIGETLVWISLFSFTYAGYSTLKNMGKEKFELLHSNGQPIFRTLDMKDRWSSFYDWAEENDISFFVIERNSNGHVTDSDFWKLDHNEIFILGDDDHRSKLMKDARQLTSHLYIRKSAWEAYLQFYKEREQEVRDQKHVSKLFTKHTSSELSVRQILFGRETKESPRFRMLIANPEFAKRYYKLDIKRAEQKPANRPCHAAIILILESKNTSTFKRIAEKNGKPQNDEDSDFLVKLDVALEVVKNKNHSRRDQILKFKWLKLEQYIEDLKIISDEETRAFCKEFYLEFDSNTI